MLAQAESVLALSNGHIGLRGQPRRGRAVRHARDLPERLLRGAPAALRRGRLRLPGGRPDRRQRHQRQAHPPAGRRRAVRRPLRRSWSRTAARSTCAPACCAARSTGARRRAARSRCARCASCPSCTARWPRSATRCAPLDGETRIVAAVRAGRQRGRAGPQRGPARGRVLRAPLVAEEHGIHDLRVVLVHRTRASALRMAAGMDHVVDGPEGTVTENESFDDLGARDGERRGRPRRDADADQVPGLRLVEPALDGRRSATRSTPRSRRRGARASTACSRTSASTSTTSGSAPTSRSTATTSSSRPCASRSSTRCRPRARAEKRAIPAKGLTGHGYDGHVFWDTESFVLPVLTYTAPDGRPRRAALAPLDARPRHRARAPAAPRRRRVPVADDPRPRVLGLLAGRHGRLPHQRRHRRRGAALPARDRRRRVRARRGARAAGGDRAAVALARPPRRARARSTSTASPGPTSTRRSPTTTSTRTSWPPGTWPARRSRARAIATRRAALGVDDEEMAAWRDAAADDRRALRRRARGPPAVGGLHAPRALGLRGDRRPTSTRCCCTSRTSTSIASRSSSRPTSCSRWSPAGDRFTRRGEGARLRLLRAADGPRLVAVGLRAGDPRRRGRPPRAGLRLLRRGRADGPRRPRAQHARRAAHGLAGRLVAGGGRRVRRLSRPRGSFSFDPRLPPHLERLAFGLMLRGRRLRVEIVPGEARYELRRRRAARAAPRRHAVHARAREPAGASRGVRRRPARPPEQPPHRAPTRRRPRGSG